MERSLDNSDFGLNHNADSMVCAAKIVEGGIPLKVEAAPMAAPHNGDVQTVEEQHHDHQPSLNDDAGEVGQGTVLAVLIGQTNYTKSEAQSDACVQTERKDSVSSEAARRAAMRVRSPPYDASHLPGESKCS